MDRAEPGGRCASGVESGQGASSRGGADRRAGQGYLPAPAPARPAVSPAGATSVVEARPGCRKAPLRAGTSAAAGLYEGPEVSSLPELSQPARSLPHRPRPPGRAGAVPMGGDLGRDHEVENTTPTRPPRSRPRPPSTSSPGGRTLIRHEHFGAGRCPAAGICGSTAASGRPAGDLRPGRLQLAARLGPAERHLQPRQRVGYTVSRRGRTIPRARAAGVRHALTRTTTTSSSPRGRGSVTIAPSRLPRSARATGAAMLMRPFGGIGLVRSDQLVGAHSPVGPPDVDHASEPDAAVVGGRLAHDDVSRICRMSRARRLVGSTPRARGGAPRRLAG